MGKMKSLVPIAISLIIAITGTVFLYKWIDRSYTSLSYSSDRAMWNKNKAGNDQSNAIS